MKRIGIDGNEANIANRVGSNVYAFELLWAMYRFLEKNQLFGVRVYLRAPARADMPPQQPWWQYRTITPAKLWTQWRLPLDLYLRNDLSLFFSPGHYTPRFSPVPVVASIMDLAFELYPEQFRAKDAFQLTTLTRRSVEKSIHLIAISEFTKQDLVRLYSYPEDNITVAYPAVSVSPRLSSAVRDSTLASLGIKKPYITFVGTLQPRKNIVRLVEAFGRIREQGRELQLVLAGKVGWLGEPIQAAIDASEWKADIIQTGFVSDQQKQAIIEGAEATALVGLYEGFGIPPLESILLGTIPVVSQVSSLPEVVGPDGVMVDPLSVESIAQGLIRVLEMSRDQKQTLLQKQNTHVRKFSWSESGERVCQALAKLL